MKRSVRALVSVAFGGLSVLAADPALARRIVATSADDVCAPDVDPCVVDTNLIVRDGAVLDFGTRSVVIAGRGKLQIHGEANEILCGSFSVQTPGRTTIRMRKGDTPAAVVTISARRACSDGVTACLRDS